MNKHSRIVRKIMAVLLAGITLNADASMASGEIDKPGAEYLFYSGAWSNDLDLTPLLHFWGIPPEDADALKAAVAAEKLPTSAKIYDALLHYKAIVPKDNKAFQDFAIKWWNKHPSPGGFTTEREHAKQWDGFSKETTAQIHKAVQDIVDEYFPNGWPEKG